MEKSELEIGKRVLHPRTGNTAVIVEWEGEKHFRWETGAYQHFLVPVSHFKDLLLTDFVIIEEKEKFSALTLAVNVHREFQAALKKEGFKDSTAPTLAFADATDLFWCFEQRHQELWTSKRENGNVEAHDFEYYYVIQEGMEDDLYKQFIVYTEEDFEFTIVVSKNKQRDW